MKLRYFGDSYDIVKRTLVSWLTVLGPWHVQPMFTDEVTPEEAQRFANFIGASLVSHERLTPSTDRHAFFNSSRAATNLFLDPDTGLRPGVTGRKAPAYLMYSELAGLVHARPQHVTLVYDQSIGRAKEEPRREELRGKLSSLREHGVLGFYYVSHAPFLIASATTGALEQAQCKLLQHLPETRLLLDRQGLTATGKAGGPGLA